jgi:hypothetical protein
METLPDRPGSYSFFHDVGNLLNDEYYTEDELYVGNEVEKRPPEGNLRLHGGSTQDDILTLR